MVVATAVAMALAEAVAMAVALVMAVAMATTRHHMITFAPILANTDNLRAAEPASRGDIRKAAVVYSDYHNNRSAVIQNVPGHIWHFFNSTAKTRRAILYHFLTV